MSLPAERLGEQPSVPTWPGPERAPDRRAPNDVPVRRPRRRRHHLGFAILATVVIGPMVLGIVTLNALLAQQSFRLDEAERRIEALTIEHLELVHEQATLSAPGRIAAWARRYGMRLPDDIRPLHASGGEAAAPAGAADTDTAVADR